MRCWKCGEQAVIFRRYEGKSRCSKHFSESFEAKVKRTIRKEHLLDQKDKVAVALSGGKDSSVVLWLLWKILNRWRKTELFAIAIDEGIDGYRDESLKIGKKLCKKLSIKLSICSFKENFGRSLDELVKLSDSEPCTLCGVFRRRLLQQAALEEGATKLTLGHNLDDEVQSIMLNHLRGDLKRLARLGAKPGLVKNQKWVPRIKPLHRIPEREVGLYALLQDLEVHQSECPYVEHSIRQSIRQFLNKLEETYPGIKFSAKAAYERLRPQLSNLAQEVELNECSQCGWPTSREQCKHCELLEELDH